MVFFIRDYTVSSDVTNILYSHSLSSLLDEKTKTQLTLSRLALLVPKNFRLISLELIPPKTHLG